MPLKPWVGNKITTNDAQTSDRFLCMESNGEKESRGKLDCG